MGKIMTVAYPVEPTPIFKHTSNSTALLQIPKSLCVLPYREHTYEWENVSSVRDVKKLSNPFILKLCFRGI
jgi:hypothetical protein